MHLRGAPGGRPQWVARLRRIGCFALGATFVASSLWKVAQPYDFLRVVYQYELLGPLAGVLAANVLPFVELVIGLCLFSGILDRGANFLSVLLLGGFSIAQVIVLSRGAKIPCGCIRGNVGDISYWDLFRTTGLFAVSLLCYFVGKPAPGRAGVGAGPVTGAELSDNGDSIDRQPAVEEGAKRTCM